MSQPAVDLEISLRRDRVVATILVVGICVEATLVLLDYFLVYTHPGQIGPFREIFWLTAEETLGTWFAASQTLLVGLTLAAIGAVARHDSSLGRPWVWWLLSSIFVYLSADDAVQIHESIGTVVEHSGDAAGSFAALIERFPTYHWQLAFGLPLLALVYLLLGFASGKLRGSGDRALLATAILLLAGAVMLDFLEGLEPGHPMHLATRISAAWDFRSFALEHFQVRPIDAVEHFLRVLEETIEMFAMTLLLAVFSGHLIDIVGDLRIRSKGARA